MDDEYERQSYGGQGPRPAPRGRGRGNIRGRGNPRYNRYETFNQHDDRGMCIQSFDFSLPILVFTSIEID